MTTNLTPRELRRRKALVARNMRELMESIGLGEKFRSPDEWVDELVERPRRQEAPYVQAHLQNDPPR